MQLIQRQFIRRGFTLLELLIVVALIALLAALSVVAMQGVTEQAEVAASTTTVLKVNSLLEQRVEAFNRAFNGSQKDAYIVGTVGLLKAVDGRFDYFIQHPDEAPPAIRLLAYKAAFRYEMPQRFVERTAAGDTISSSPPAAVAAGMPLSIYQSIAVPNAIGELTADGGATPTNAEVNALVASKFAAHTPETESAELLYFALVKSGNFGAFSGGADQFTGDEIADTDGDGLPEFVDAWGQPLRFYRWPTRLFDPNAPNPFAPVFATVNDNTEVDPTPLDDDGDTSTVEDTDALREIMPFERDNAGLLVKGLPPSPVQIGTSIQRDLMLVDPDDPVGILYTFIEDPQYVAMGIDLTEEFNEAKYHTPDTYHSPLIVSAGADGILGLREPTDVVPGSGIYGNLAQFAGTTATAPNPSAATLDALFDNLTNRNRRAGASR